MTSVNQGGEVRTLRAWGNLNGVSNAQGGDLGCSVCLLELPVSLAQTMIWDRAVKVS